MNKYETLTDLEKIARRIKSTDWRDGGWLSPEHTREAYKEIKNLRKKLAELKRNKNHVRYNKP